MAQDRLCGLAEPVVTHSMSCPTCGRILFTTAENTYPYHFDLKHGLGSTRWCYKSAHVVVRR